MGARLTKQALLRGFLPLALVGIAGAASAPLVAVDRVCGVDTYHAPNTLQDCKAQSATNLLFDQGNAAEAREGLVTYIQTGIPAPVRGSWWFKEEDGTDWYVGLASGTLFAYDGSSTSTILSGLDSDNRMDCTQCLGDFYCVNRSTHLFSWDGTSVTYSTHAPVASLVECWRNRIVLGDISGEQSTLYLSGELAPDAYTPATQSTSPLTWRVGGVNDAGNRLRCMRAGYGDFLFLGTPSRTYGFFGTDTRDFELNELSSDVGCLDDGTVQEHLGELTWVSNQGVERFDRNVLRYPRVSEDIRNVTDSLIASAVSEFSWIQNSQTDFQQGTHDQTSDAISPGNVVLSTSSDIDNDSTDFGGGTASDTSVIGDRVYLSTNNTNVDNNSFETSDGSGGALNWTESSMSRGTGSLPGCSGGSVAVQNGSAYLTGSGIFSFSVRILDSTGATLATPISGQSTSCGSWTNHTVDLSAYAGRWIKIQVRLSGSVHTTSDAFLCSGGTLSFYSIAVPIGGSHFDNFTLGRSTIYSGTFTGASFDTGYSSASFVATTASWVTNGHVISMETQESADGSSWGTAVSWSTGSAPSTVSWARHKRYVVTFSTGGTTNGTALPYLTSSALGARAATGTFVSDAKDVSGNTSWGNFEANQTEADGSIAYFVRSAATEGGLTAASWVAQTPFTSITASVNNWVQYKASFTLTAAEGDPTHHDASIFWRTGASSPAMASVVFRDRYHLFYTTSTSENAYNDITAPLDRFGQWTFFSGVTAASATRFRNLMLYGDSNSTGKVFRLYSGYNDNGAAIPVRLALKDFDGGNMDALKILDKLYITAGHEAEDTNDVEISVSYTIDGDATAFELDSFNLGESVGRINVKIPFPVDGGSLLQGRWISPILSGDVLDTPLQLFGIRIYGEMGEVE